MKRPKPRTNLNGAWYDVAEMNEYVSQLEHDRLQWALGIIRELPIAPPIKKLIEDSFKSHSAEGGE